MKKVSEPSTEGQGKIIQIDEERINKRLDEMVLDSVESTLNGLLDKEADRLCGAGRYKRSERSVDTRAGIMNSIKTSFNMIVSKRLPAILGRIRILRWSTYDL